MASFDPQLDTQGPERPSYQLYSVRSIVLATFFGWFVAGGILMAINYRRLGQAGAAWAAVVLGILGTAGVMGLVLRLPGNVLIVIFSVIAAQAAVIYCLGQSLQGPALIDHQLAGGRLASAGVAFGIGLACMLLVLAAFLVPGFILLNELGTRVSVNINDEIYYSGDATEDDARELARILTDLNHLGHPQGSTVLLFKSASGFTISFVTAREARDDPRTVGVFRTMGEALAAGGFGRPLVIELCDEHVEPKKTLRIE